MVRPCSKCGGPPNIKINMLNYCNGCFETQLLGKIYKSLAGIAPNTKILVYLAESSASAALYDILDKFFRARGHYRVAIFCGDRISKLCEERLDGSSGGFYPAATMLSDADLDSGRNEVCNGRAGDGILEYCEKNGVSVIIYQETLEKTLVDSLEMLCCGRGDAAASNMSPEQRSKIKVINPFGNIKDKAILYYIYIRNIERLEGSQSKNRVKKTLSDFLHETDEKNSLALFNIANTLKKLNER